MKPSAQNIYKDCKESHSRIYKLISELRHEIDSCNNYVELCDYAFAVDQSHDLIEDTKKELWKLKELIIKKVCELWMMDMMRPSANKHDKKERSIRTDYVTATCDIKQAPNIPTAKSDPAAHKQLMEYLGIDISNWPLKPDGTLDEVVKPHWPGLVSLVTEELAKGKPAPPGIDITKLMPVYKLTMRKKKDVDK